jgi:hypothetical protein
VAATGCADVRGGAVEARWFLRNGQGEIKECAELKIQSVRCVLEPVAGGPDPCASEASCLFECTRTLAGAVTGFVIPEGSYGIALGVVDQDGQLLGPQDGVAAPAPVVRQVREGQVTGLNVNLIIVDR